MSLAVVVSPALVTVFYGNFIFSPLNFPIYFKPTARRAVFAEEFVGYTAEFVVYGIDFGFIEIYYRFILADLILAVAERFGSVRIVSKILNVIFEFFGQIEKFQVESNGSAVFKRIDERIILVVSPSEFASVEKLFRNGPRNVNGVFGRIYLLVAYRVDVFPSIVAVGKR